MEFDDSGVRPERFDFPSLAAGAAYFRARHIDIEKQLQPASVLGLDEPWPDWLDLSDFGAEPVLVRRHREIRIVLIFAAAGRHGVMRRLVQGIVDSGAAPVVVCPVLDVMPALLCKWNWWMQIGGVGEEWRPRKGQLYGPQ